MFRLVEFGFVWFLLLLLFFISLVAKRHMLGYRFDILVFFPHFITVTEQLFHFSPFHSPFFLVVSISIEAYSFLHFSSLVLSSANAQRNSLKINSTNTYYLV